MPSVRAPLCLVVVSAWLVAGTLGCSGNPQSQLLHYVSSGDQYLAAGKPAEAIIEYLNALRIDPNAGPARAKVGEAYLQTRELDKAVAAFVRAADLMQDDADLQVKTGGLWLILGQFEDAQRIAERLLLRQPRHVPALVLRANALAGLQSLGDAIEQIEEAIQLDPEQGSLYSNLGSFQARTGRLDEAQIAFEQAVQVAPDSADAHTALAQFYMATRRPALAEKALLQAIQLDPKYVLARRALTTLYAETGRPVQAGEHLKAIADIVGDVESRVELADFYLLTRRRDEGVTLLEEIASDAGGYFRARTRLAALAYSEGRREEAHQIVDEVLAKARYAEAMLLKARFLRLEGDITGALTRARTALETNPFFLQAHYMAGELYLQTGDKVRAADAFSRVLRINPRAGAAQAHLARLELSKGSLQSSLELSERAVRNAPADITARLTLVRVLVQQGNARRADEELAAIAKQFPNAATVHALKGNISLVRRDFPTARRSYEQALARDPNSFDALAGLTALDLTTGQTASARDRVDRELQRKPGDIDRVMLAAQTYSALGDMKKTEELLLSAIATGPDRTEPYGTLAQFYVQQNRLEEGKQVFQGIIERDPRAVGAQTMVGLILRKQNRTDEAIEQYKKALAIDAEAAVAANNLAWIYADRGQMLEEGLRLARVARAKLPNRPEVIDTIGWLYYKSRQPDLAIPYLREAIDLSPRNPQFRYHLAATYARTGDSRLAKVTLQEALKLGTDFPEIEDARRLLARLR